jgi:hypothetical protein
MQQLSIGVLFSRGIIILADPSKKREGRAGRRRRSPLHTPAIAFPILMAWLTGVALAQKPDAFDACGKETDSAARLACFDRALAARHSIHPAPASSESRAGASAAAPVAASAASRSMDSDVGLDARQLRKQREERGEPEPPAPGPIVARVVKVIPRRPLISAFELDNGQIWEQTEAMNFVAEPQQEVTVRQGVLGAFFLKSATGAVVRVHRVK